MLAVLGHSDACVATHPGDMSVALAALGAEVHLHGGRTVAIPGLHRLPGEEPQRDTVLEPGDLITAIEVADPPGAVRYRKVRDRASYAFAVVSVAALLRVEDGVVADARIALGGVAHVPWRAETAEAELIGNQATDAAFAAAADAELAQAPAAARQRLQGRPRPQPDHRHPEGAPWRSLSARSARPCSASRGTSRSPARRNTRPSTTPRGSSHAVIVQAPIAKGRIERIEDADGALLTLSFRNAPSIEQVSDGELFVLQGPEVAYRGQIVALRSWRRRSRRRAPARTRCTSPSLPTTTTSSSRPTIPAATRRTASTAATRRTR